MRASKKLESFLQTCNETLRKNKESNVVATPETARAALKGLLNFTMEKERVASIEDQLFDGIPVRIYNPHPDKPLPVIVFAHGGGHVCGSVEVYDYLTRKIANRCEAIVISVDYPLAPEQPYPEGIEATYKIVKNAKSIAKNHKHTNELIIAGDSAGGAIMATVSARALENNLKIDKQILLYPSLDYTCSFPSYQENGEGYFLENARISWYFDLYLGKTINRRKVSPVFGKISCEMPKTLIITGEVDPLRDEGRCYANKLKEHGVYADYVEMQGMIHAYLFLEKLVPEECEATHKKISEFVRS